MSQDTFATVKQVLIDGLSVEDESVTLEASISDDLGADSLDAVEIIMSLEDEFDVQIDSSKAEELQTVADIVNLIDSLK